MEVVTGGQASRRICSIAIARHIHVDILNMILTNFMIVVNIQVDIIIDLVRYKQNMVMLIAIYTCMSAYETAFRSNILYFFQRSKTFI